MDSHLTYSGITMEVLGMVDCGRLEITVESDVSLWSFIIQLLSHKNACDCRCCPIYVTVCHLLVQIHNVLFVIRKVTIIWAPQSGKSAGGPTWEVWGVP